MNDAVVYAKSALQEATGEENDDAVARLLDDRAVELIVRVPLYLQLAPANV